MLKLENVGYTYQSKYQMVEAVKDISYVFEEGKLYAIVGESGCGKSTLVSLLGGLDLPTKGKIFVGDKTTISLDLDIYRRDVATIVYQNFNLLPLLTAAENVAFPMELKGVPGKVAKKRAKELLLSVGIKQEKQQQFPKMMSGGEQQRVAIARALASQGKVLLADEPTGNLDSENERVIVELLNKLAHEQQYIVIVVTHNQLVAQSADEVLCMKDGMLTNRNQEHEYDYTK